MSLTIEPVTPEAEAEWDDFGRRQTAWTPYHAYCWSRVIAEVHGHQCFYLGARGEDGTLRGVLPLVQVRSRLFGRYLMSIPFVNYGGPLGDDESVTALVEEAVRLSDAQKVDLLELRAAAALPLDLSVSHRKITVLLDLPKGDAEPLWEGLKAKVRSQVRRPMKEGVEVRFGADQLDGFYEVFGRHMRDLGTPVQPRRFFARLSEALGEQMWIGCAYLEGQPVAAGVGFRWADKFELVWASALREFNRIAPNMLLYWRFFERCVEDGAEIFDFGRCTPGGRTHRFKSQWGGRDAQLWWYQHGPKSGAGTPSPDSGPLSLGPKVWRKLPVPIANMLGPRIVRFIP